MEATKHKQIWLMASIVGTVSILFAFFSITANAAEIAPEDLPSSASLEEVVDNEKPITGDVADDLFPAVEVQNPTKPTGELNESLFSNRFIGGDSVILSEDLDHDVFVGANDLTIDAHLGNDLIAAANTITVDGVIEGSVRLFANTVIVQGVIKKNALIFANTIIIEDEALIMGDTTLGGASVTVNGTIEKTAELYGNNVIINGPIRGQIKTEGKNVTIGEHAEFSASVSVTAPQLDMSSKAIGTTFVQHTKQLSKKTFEPSHRADRHSDLTQWITSLFFFGALGILLILIWPQWMQRVVTAMEKETGRTWERGLLFFFVAPILLFALIFTVIGIPITLMGTVAYIFALFFGRMVFGMYLGKHLVHAKFSKDKKKQQIAEYVAGYFVLSVLYSLPWIGWIICMLASIWGVGAIKHAILADRSKRKKRKK